MKRVKLAAVEILDFGSEAEGNCHIGEEGELVSLVVVPLGIMPERDYNGAFPVVDCGGYESFRTVKGRPAIRVLPGEGWTMSFQEREGDRYWWGWAERHRVGIAFSIASATTRGGGCWAELDIVPLGGAPTAEEAEMEEELAGLDTPS